MCSHSSNDTQEPANRWRAGFLAVSTTTAQLQGSFNTRVLLSCYDLRGKMLF